MKYVHVAHKGYFCKANIDSYFPEFEECGTWRRWQYMQLRRRRMKQGRQVIHWCHWAEKCRQFSFGQCFADNREFTNKSRSNNSSQRRTQAHVVGWVLCSNYARSKVRSWMCAFGFWHHGNNLLIIYPKLVQKIYSDFVHFNSWRWFIQVKTYHAVHYCLTFVSGQRRLP